MKRTIILLMFILPISILSQIAQTINWQGIIQDANGNNLDGNYSITVTLFDVGNGGTEVWSELHNAVAITDGLTNLSLGSVTPFNLNFDKQYWLEITVGNGTPLQRIKLQSVPYSFHSLVADSLSGKIDETDPTWSGSNDTTGIIYRFGSVAIGTSSPKAPLHIYGIETGEGNVLFTGTNKISNPGLAPDSGFGTRMMWYPDKAAFRAGFVQNDQWNSDNIGYFSAAFGSNTIASGHYSIAMGLGTSATGNFSYAVGESSHASGEVSTAMGDGNKASGDFSTAMGESTTASGLYSTSMGKGTIASGYNASSFGRVTTASGDFSTTFGENTFAESAYETTFGRWNTDYSPANTSGWNTSDRLLVVGNGTTSNSRSNALTILKNGKIGIGTDLPLALLHTKGMGSGEGNVLFTGSAKTIGQGLAPDSGAGTRMMWYPDKAAFRAGNVFGNQWNTSNIGNFSIAMGNSTTASGNTSTAFGEQTTASGVFSTAIGAFTKASGSYSTAAGYNTKASGNTSTAFGVESNASGSISTAMGCYTSAKSAFETVLGIWNTDYSPVGSTVWNTNDRLFVVGNGTDADSRSNALTILKNGKVGIGTDSPSALIHAKGLNTGDGNILFNGAYKTINPGLAPDSGAGTRLMWYPDKSAFRAGTVEGNQWNTENIGSFSTAFGLNSKASGKWSFAIGENNIASGISSLAAGSLSEASGNVSIALGYSANATNYYAVAIGNSTTASGAYATAIGFNTTASGGYSTAMGQLSLASGTGSTAMGYKTIAFNNYSTAMGYKTSATSSYATSMGSNSTASGNSSTALGDNTTASGTASTALGNSSTALGGYSTAMGSATISSGSISTAMGYTTIASGYISTSMGSNTTASGDYSIAMGELTIAKSFSETVIGRLNDDYTPGSATYWNENDRLFVVGNGADSNLRSNAITIMKSGRIGLQSVTDPDFALDLPNVAYDGIGRARANAWATYSDGRLKTERKAIIYGLKEIMMLSPLSYYQHNSIFNNGKLEISDKGAYSFGFIAQDLFKIIPEIVSKPENENTGLWSLSYEKLTPILVKAIQEQQEIIDNQKKKNDSQDMLIQIQNQEIKQQNKKIEELEKKLEILMKNFNSNK